MIVLSVLAGKRAGESKRYLHHCHAYQHDSRRPYQLAHARRRSANMEWGLCPKLSPFLDQGASPHAPEYPLCAVRLRPEYDGGARSMLRSAAAMLGPFG